MFYQNESRNLLSVLATTKTRAQDQDDFKWGSKLYQYCALLDLYYENFILRASLVCEVYFVV